jgi:hypothetical protein
LKTFKQFINETQRIKPERIYDIPLFSGTLYSIPRNEQLSTLSKYDITSDQLLEGLGYIIIGRGIKNQKNTQQILTSLENLHKLFPTNEEYKKALDTFKNENI